MATADVRVLAEACAVCGLRTELAGRNPVRIIAESTAMHGVMRRVARIAPSGAGVLLIGESGTGKEVVARSIHDASQRRNKPFVAVNCAALPPDLLESELFGHARGAFTGAVASKRGLFEEADGGTLFLDEIGELPAGLQAKLLRALQEGEVRRVGENTAAHVDVRVVAATNRDLAKLVKDGLFREDLYYRLKVFQIALPPLRERRDDILPLAHMLLERERAGLSLSPAADEVLRSYSWPGNVRELANAIRHGAVLAERGVVEPEHLPPEICAARSDDGAAVAAGPAMPAGAAPAGIGGAADTAGAHTDASWSSPAHDAHLSTFTPTAPLDDVVRAHVMAAVDAFGGNRAAAARALGVGRNTLWRWLKGRRGACNRKGAGGAVSPSGDGDD